jgi:hypothetical protein
MYPKRHPKYSHLGKNLEMVINKALSEQDPEKKDGFAHAIAYYMKLAYSNWHKELVHDDAIRSELDNITGGELEFSNTPFIKHRVQNFERDDYRGGNTGGGRRQSFSSRSGGRDNRGRDNRDNRNQNRSNSGGNRENRNNNNGNRNQNFKKRFK